MIANQGRIELIIGPMFSGKSTELIRRIRRQEISGKKCLKIKYREDTRYSDGSISTHDLMKIKAISCDKLMETLMVCDGYQVIGIDEGQFFQDVVQFAEQAANDGKIVIVSALDGTFMRTGFENIMELIPKAEKVKKLRAICRDCGEDASFSHKLSQNNQIKEIGGADLYKPLCRVCYQKNNPQDQ